MERMLFTLYMLLWLSFLFFFLFGWAEPLSDLSCWPHSSFRVSANGKPPAEKTTHSPAGKPMPYGLTQPLPGTNNLEPETWNLKPNWTKEYTASHQPTNTHITPSTATPQQTTTKIPRPRWLPDERIHTLNTATAHHPYMIPMKLLSTNLEDDARWYIHSSWYIFHHVSRHPV